MNELNTPNRPLKQTVGQAALTDSLSTVQLSTGAQPHQSNRGIRKGRESLFAPLLATSI